MNLFRVCLRAMARFFGLARAFLRRDFLEAASYRFAFALRFIWFFLGLGTVYFTARFVNMGHNPLLAPYGGDYFTFSLVGLIVMDFQHVSVSAFSTRIRQAQTLGTLEAILATPAPFGAVLLASPLYDFLSSALRAVLYLVAGSLLFNVHVGSAKPFVTLVGGILGLFTFVSLGLCAGAFTLLLRKGDPISLFLGGVSMLLGGVWYPRAALPHWLTWLGDLLPVTHTLEIVRRSLFAGAGFGELGRPFLALALLGAVFFPLGLVLFRAALRRAREEGSLTHY